MPRQRRPLRDAECWRVNSYGYPSPFATKKEAWQTLLSFFSYTSYSDLKEYWASSDAPRRIDHATVESWKAAFEEYGLLYVPTGSGEIHIMPAGYQLREAGLAEDREAFAWVGLSVLLRYPLREPREPRGTRQGDSDILPYWFFYAALRELQDYVWWSELERVLCKVFSVSQAEAAVSNIAKLRAGDLSIDDFALPAGFQSTEGTGGLYNDINQIIVHAGLNHLLLSKSNEDSIYGLDYRKTRVTIRDEWLPLIDLALQQNGEDFDCEGSSRFISRMPQAPDFRDDEETYFDYLGAEVPSMSSVAEAAAIPTVNIGGEVVSILKEGAHFRRVNPTRITGSIRTLCRLARNQRVILSDNLVWSYMVENKTRTSGTGVAIDLRRAAPITNPQPIRQLLED